MGICKDILKKFPIRKNVRADFFFQLPGFFGNISGRIFEEISKKFLQILLNKLGIIGGFVLFVMGSLCRSNGLKLCRLIQFGWERFDE